MNQKKLLKNILQASDYINKSATKGSGNFLVVSKKTAQKIDDAIKEQEYKEKLKRIKERFEQK